MAEVMTLAQSHLRRVALLFVAPWSGCFSPDAVDENLSAAEGSTSSSSIASDGGTAPPGEDAGSSTTSDESPSGTSDGFTSGASGTSDSSEGFAIDLEPNVEWVQGVFLDIVLATIGQQGTVVWSLDPGGLQGVELVGGSLVGAPTNLGAFTLSFSANDGAGQMASATVQVTVRKFNWLSFNEGGLTRLVDLGDPNTAPVDAGFGEYSGSPGLPLLVEKGTDGYRIHDGRYGFAQPRDIALADAPGVPTTTPYDEPHWASPNMVGLVFDVGSNMVRRYYEITESGYQVIGDIPRRLRNGTPDTAIFLPALNVFVMATDLEEPCCEETVEYYARRESGFELLGTQRTEDFPDGVLPGRFRGSLTGDFVIGISNAGVTLVGFDGTTPRSPYPIVDPIGYQIDDFDADADSWAWIVDTNGVQHLFFFASSNINLSDTEIVIPDAGSYAFTGNMLAVSDGAALRIGRADGFNLANESVVDLPDGTGTLAFGFSALGDYLYAGYRDGIYHVYRIDGEQAVFAFDLGVQTGNIVLQELAGEHVAAQFLDYTQSVSTFEIYHDNGVGLERAALPPAIENLDPVSFLSTIFLISPDRADLLLNGGNGQSLIHWPVGGVEARTVAPIDGVLSSESQFLLQFRPRGD